MHLLVTTSSVDQTRDLGTAVSAMAGPGDVVVLAGDLGAGKTAFVQGFGRGLGVAERITSPTFTIVHVYEGGRLPIHHIDVYRLDQLSEVLDLGLAEMLDEGGVVLIEWGDAIAAILPNDYLEVRVTFGEGDDDRQLAVAAIGPGWASRMEPMATALAAWGAG